MSQHLLNKDVVELQRTLGAESLEDSTLFHGSKNIIITPVEILNTFMNGGIPSSSIIEVFGEPQGGKSTLVYSCAGYFHQSYKDSIVYIIDSEKSVEKIRMVKFFGMDPGRTIVQKIDYLQEGFTKIEKLLKKLKDMKSTAPVMVIWDTIANSRSLAQTENIGNLNAGGMQEIPKLIKQGLAVLSTYLDGLGGVSLWLLNQVFTSNDGHRFFTDSGGGFGLKHGAHYKIEIEKGPEIWEGLDSDSPIHFIKSYQYSEITLHKTKSTTQLKNIPLVLNTLEGGFIEKELSVLYFFKNNGIITEKKGSDGQRGTGWYPLKVGGVEKNYRFSDLEKLIIAHKEVFDYYIEWWKYIIAKKSSYLRTVYYKKFISDIELENLFTKLSTDFTEFLLKVDMSKLDEIISKRNEDLAKRRLELEKAIEDSKKESVN